MTLSGSSISKRFEVVAQLPRTIPFAGADRLDSEDATQTYTLASVALVAAVITSVRLSVVLFGFPHCVSTIGEFPQILAIHHIRHVGTPILMNLMIPIRLRVLIHIVGSHE
jgi:hypothetical protein